MGGATAERRRRHAVRHRLWGLGVLAQAGIDLHMANRQLVLPPEGGGFRAGVSPIPLTERSKVDPTFEGSIQRGTNPAGKYFALGDARYCLAERVEEHLPGSREWLLEKLEPYFDDRAPDIGLARASQGAMLQQLGLRRLSWSAASFSEAALGETHWYLAQKQLEYLAKIPSPTHLQLLISFYHEQTWQHPLAARRHYRYMTLIRDAYELAVETLSSLPFLRLADTRVDMEREIDHAFRHVRGNIEFLGLRSEGTEADEENTLLSPTLFVQDFADFEDADFCAGLGYAVPLEHREDPQRYTRFSEGPEPTPQEALEALWQLLAHLELDRDTHLVDLHVTESSLAGIWSRFQRCE